MSPVQLDCFSDDEPPVTKTGVDGSEIDKFKRDPLCLFGLLLSGIVIGAFYLGFRAFTDHLYTEDNDEQQIGTTLSEDDGETGRVREPELQRVHSD